MVLIELAGLTISSSKVIGRTISRAFTQAAAMNAPNGNPIQRFIGAVFGIESTTQMIPSEARQVLNFDNSEKLTHPVIRQRLDQMLTLNDLNQGGSPYLNDRFIAAAHVLSRLD